MRRLTLILTALLAVTACAAPTGTVSDPSAGPVSVKATAEQKPAPTWGQRYTWPSGLAVEIPKPATCTPTKNASPAGVKRAVKVTIKVTNGTDKPFETSVLSVGADVQFAGTKPELVVDMTGPCKAGIGMESATVLPGKSYSYEVAYAVTAEPGELQIVLTPEFGQGKAAFVGQA
jgi:hypothetical protein